MKIDRSKLKKSSSEVPLDCKGLIDTLTSCCKQDFLGELKKIETWTYGKCELLHWIDVLDRCDDVLESACAREPNSWVLACDTTDGSGRLKELVLWTLHFTTLLIEHSFSRHLYSSMEHLTTLLSSSDLDVVLAVLNLLYMFSKRSNFITRLAPEKRQILLSRLTHLAASWGGRDNGFGLSKCCSDDDISTFPDSATTLHFEFYSEQSAETSSSSKRSTTTSVIVIHMEHVDQIKKSPANIMETLLTQYAVPEEKQMLLFTYLRLAHSFSNYSKRLKCVQARLQALSVLIYSNQLTDNVQSLLYPGLLEELVEVLEMQGDNLMEIKAAALKSLTSIIHLDRNPNFPKLNTIIDVTGAGSYHGFLPVMVRNCIMSLTGTSSPSSDKSSQPFPQPLATALFSFLYHLASYEAGGEALVSCGMMESLLKVIQWPSTELDHITFVTRAVRVIDLITNLDMQSFQTHQGLMSFIGRLELEVEHCRKQQPFQIQVGPVRRDSLTEALEGRTGEEEAMEVDEQPSTSDTVPDYSAAKTGLTCLPQRAALLKSMLNFLKKAIQDPAFSDSIRHVMDGSLPESLKHIISNAEYYGPSLFLLATDVVTAYVFQEPSLLSSLQDKGLTDVVLHALLVKDVPATREVLGSLPNVFSALCLNTRGLNAFVACKPFERLFKVLLSPDYLPAMRRRRSSDPMGDTASNLGNAMDELMRHQPSLKQAATGAIIKLLEEVCALGRDPKYICWKSQPKPEQVLTPPVQPNNTGEGASSDEEEEEEEEGNVANGQTTTPQEQQPMPSPEKEAVPLVDYIHNVMKFVDAILSNNSTDDHCREFVQQKGLVPLMGILGLPNLPIDFPAQPACQAVAAVCKSILNLAHEPQVLKQGLLHLNEVLKNLEPLHTPLEPPGGSVLLHELVSAPNISEATSNPQTTPLLHHMAAAHAYIQMFVHVCRTGQSDIRTISISHWGSELGLSVLKGLSRLYTSLVWESTVLLALCSEDTLPAGCEFGKADMDKLLPPNITADSKGAENEETLSPSSGTSADSNSSVTMAMENLSTDPVTAMDVDSTVIEVKQKEKCSPALHHQIKQIKPLLSGSSRLGRALAELFALLVKLCVGSPLRQRRGQQIPPTPAPPSPPARAVASALTKLLASGLSWEPPATSPIPRFRLTFYICSVGFTAPMLFDEKKYPFHLMLMKFMTSGGQRAFFDTFDWALSCGGRIPPEQGLESPDLPDGTGEFLDSWLMLLEKMVNPKAVLESPHTLPAKQTGNFKPFDPLKYIVRTHKLAFQAVMKLWNKRPLKVYGAHMSELVLSILCHILKGEKLMVEKMEKEKEAAKPPLIPETSTASTAAPAAAASSSTASASSNNENPPAAMSSVAAAIAAAANNEPTEPDIDPEHLQRLMDMGFPRERCIEAIQSTPTIEQATDYLLSNPIAPLGQVFGGSGLGEQDDLMRAIAMSLGENVIMSTDQQTDNPEQRREQEEEDESMREDEEALSKEVIDDFTEEALAGCLCLLDTLPETVYKVCDLLLAIFNRDGIAFKERVLKRLIHQVRETVDNLMDMVNPLTAELSGDHKQITSNPGPPEQYEDLYEKLIKCEDTKRAAARIHLFTLLFEECKLLCAKIVEESQVVQLMTPLLFNTFKLLRHVECQVGKAVETPKWMTPMLLFIDLNEKVVLGMNRRAALTKVCSHTWRWFDVSSGKWCTYAQTNNKTIDDAFWAGETNVKIQTGRRKYNIKFGSMMQANEETGNQRPIMISLKSKQSDTERRDMEMEQEVANLVDTPSQPEEEPSFAGAEGLSTEEGVLLLRACIGLVSVPVDPDALNAVLRLCLRLTQDFERAIMFTQLGGVKLLLDLTQASSFSGFASLTTLLIRHVLEDPATLKHTMEKVIRSSTATSNASNTKELHYLLRMLAPAACRAPTIFAEVARDVLRVDLNLLNKRGEPEDDHRLLVKSLPAKPATAPIAQEVSQTVIRELLNFLVQVFPEEEEKTENENSTTASAASSSQRVGVPFEDMASSVQGGTRHQIIMRNSSSGELQVPLAENSIPSEPKADKSAVAKKEDQSKRRPLLSKSMVCKLLAELVKSYGGCAKMITDHMYEAGMTDLIKDDMSALSFLLDELLTNKTDKDSAQYVKTLVAALASCNQYPDAQGTLVIEVKSALARALVFPESPMKHTKIQALTGLISTMIESCPSSVHTHSTPYKQQQYHMNNIVKMMLKRGLITDLARVPHSLDLSSPGVAATINAALKPLETLSRIVNQPTSLPTSRPVKHKSEASETAETNVQECGTNTTNSEATRAQGDEVVEQDAEATEHDVSTAAESMDPNSESQLQTVEEGNAEEFDDMMEQLLEHDGGAQDQIIAEVIQENRNHEADETHDSQMLTQDESHFETQQMSQGEEDHESDSSHSAASDQEDGMEEEDAEDEDDGEEEEDEEDEDDDDDGESPFDEENDDFQELEDAAIYRFPLADHDHDEIDLMIHYPDPDNALHIDGTGGRDGSRAIHLPLWSDVNGVGGGGGVIETGSGNAPSHVTPTHPLLMGRHVVETAAGARGGGGGSSRTLQRHRGFRGFIHLNSRGQNNPSAPAILQNFLGTDAGNLLATQGLRARTPLLVDFGYAILDSLENEMPDLDGGVLGSGGRACLSAIPSALVRWNEESRVIDGDSMHDCVTALKPDILEIIERVKEEELAERRAKKKKQQEEEEAKRKAAKKDEEPAAAAAATPATTENTIEDGTAAENPPTTSSSEVTVSRISGMDLLSMTRAAVSEMGSGSSESRREPSDQRSVAAQLAGGLIAAISSRSSQEQRADQPAAEEQAPPATEAQAAVSRPDYMLPSSLFTSSLQNIGDLVTPFSFSNNPPPPPFPTIPIPPTNSDISVPIPTSAAAASEQPEPEVLPAALAPLSPSPDQDPQQQASGTDQDVSMNSEPGPSEAPTAGTSSGEVHVGGPDYSAILGNIEIPEGVDPSFLAALPEDMRQEVIDDQRRLATIRRRAQDASATEGIGEVTEEFLAALPPNIQEEVLAQQRIEQQRRQAQQNPEAPVDPTEFFQTLPASLRQSVLADMEESQMSALPPDLAAEAQTIRREFEQRNRAMMHERFFSHVNQSGSALSSILRNTVNRLGSQYVISSLPGSGRDWRPGYNRTGHPASLMAGASALKFRGKQLLDHEGLSCLLILLFIDDPKINTTRLHRILRNLCYHAPTRDWVIRSLLSILEKANEGTRQDESIPDAPTTAKLRKGNAKSETTKTSMPSWLNLSMDAALGFRANVFQVTKSQSTGGKRSSTSSSAEKHTSSAVNIHPGASALVCRHTLEVLISLAKSFPVHFLPWKDIELGGRDSTSSESKSKQTSSATKTKTDGNVSVDFWDTLLKLDQQSGSRKGKSVARSHSSVSGFKSESEDEWLCFENSPFGQLLGMLSNPVIRRSSVLTDKLLRLLSLISLGQPDIYKRPASNEKKSEEGEASGSSSNDNNSISRNHLRLAVDVLTSKACSEEGLEDVTALLLNLSYGPAPTRDTILSLLLQGAQELGGVVRQNILDLKRELEMYKRKTQVLAEEEDPSSDQKRSGAIVDRFTKETVVLTAPLKVKGGELQLPSMNTLTNKTSSQAFFLRVLKVIIQLREAALLAMKKSKALAEQEQKAEADKAAALQQQQETPAAAPGEEEPPSEAAVAVIAAPPATAPTAATVRPPSNADEMEIEIVQHDLVPSAEAAAATVVEEQSNEVEGLDPLSEQLNLTALWDALSSCLKDLADTSDHHAVLVLQATVEAFFLVHSAATQPDEKRKIHYKETRQEQLGHILETPQLRTVQTEDGETVSQQPESLLSQTSVDKNATVKELSKETKKFLDFAETHRTVLNQILRQSTTHLSDGPFSVLVDHTRVLDFDIKRRYFRTELERMDEGIRREDLAVHVKRENVFEDSFRELHRRSPEEWKNRFYIVFEGEEGQDAGGLLREWYVIISREIFNPMYALFKVSPGDKVTYMIYESSQTNPNHLDYFKFVGRVIAKAIYDNKLLECYFTRSFYKHILARTVKYTDMESEDFEFYRGLEFLTNNKVEDIGYELTFSVEIQEFGVTEVRDLIPNGRNISVTEDTKMDYIRLVCQMKMTGAIRKQLGAFLEGFYSIIPRRLISIFNEQELELLLSGLPTIDTDDLKANTEYHKYQANSLHIVWFWRALRSFDQTDKAKFMQFVTGSSKVPLQGFAALEGMNGPQKFQIHRDDRSTDRLPSAHTCFNQLDLPAYETYDKLRTYLLKAVQECSEGFGFA